MFVRVAGGPIGRAFFAICLMVGVLLIVVDDVALIHYLNIVTMAVSGGAAVAYFPIAYHAFHHPYPRMVHVYAFGAECIWVGLFLSRVIAMMTRTHWGNWIRDSDAVSLFLILVLIGGVCQFNAHMIENGALPPKQWGKFGAIVAGAILVAAFLWHYKNVVTVV